MRWQPNAPRRSGILRLRGENIRQIAPKVGLKKSQVANIINRFLDEAVVAARLDADKFRVLALARCESVLAGAYGPPSPSDAIRAIALYARLVGLLDETQTVLAVMSARRASEAEQRQDAADRSERGFSVIEKIVTARARESGEDWSLEIEGRRINGWANGPPDQPPMSPQRTTNGGST